MLYMENARKAFSEACGVFRKNNQESQFYHKLALMIPDRVDVETLILAIKIALADADREGINTVSFIAIIPQYIRQCASSEFTHEFRKKFNRDVLGLERCELQDVDYGYNEIEKDVIDISNKDRYEVFAALYNASIPVGKGFMNYNPTPWTRDSAKLYFDKYEHAGFYDETVSFDWVFGRLVPCTFKGNLVYVEAYNLATEDQFAQKVIATVPNSQKNKTFFKS